MRLRLELLDLIGVSGAFIALLVVGAAGGAPSAPEWQADEMKQLFGLAQSSAQAPPDQKDAQLLALAARAYRFTPSGPPSIERHAEQILKRRRPEHPAVQAGQWLYALMRQFYEDAGTRAEALARFERHRPTRQYFEDMAKQSRGAAEYLGTQIQFVVEGMDEAIGALPMIGGEAPSKRGALTVVKGMKIAIDTLDRTTFVGDLPKDTEPRTPKGAIKELYSALKQFNIQSKMFGEYDRKWRENGGHVQVAVPAAKPAIYLNEVVRAAVPAEMHTLHLLTMTKSGELREIAIAIDERGLDGGKAAKKRKKKKQKKTKPTAVKCDDAMAMEDCAKRIVHANKTGPALFVAP